MTPDADKATAGSATGDDLSRREGAGAVRARRVDGALAVWFSVGFVLGGLTVAGLCLLYRATWHGWILSPLKADEWKGPTLLIGSALVVLVLYVMAMYIGQIRIGDWLVIGYAIPLIVAAALVISVQIFLMLRSHVPESIGLKTVAVMPLAPTRAG